MTSVRRALPQGIVRCHVCGLVCEHVAGVHDLPCPRCHAALHPRIPDSLSQTWALLLTGLLLYLPANLLPVMYNSFAGQGSESTIIGGIAGFWSSGSYGIAVVIFIASIMVPCAKFGILSWLLIATKRRGVSGRIRRSHLFRLTEHIGYWSMLDVMVVALISALVQFPGFSTAEPRIGIVFFGAVVIFTLLAAMKFDPRLLWENNKND
ncbi:paraquat-inducible protein A [Ewingella sp. S1.OA.A_B6]